jgi:hypothetical protein
MDNNLLQCAEPRRTIPRHTNRVTCGAGVGPPRTWMDELPCRSLSSTSNTRRNALAPLSKPKTPTAALSSSSLPTSGGATPSACASKRLTRRHEQAGASSVPHEGLIAFSPGAHGAIVSSAPSPPPDVPRTSGMRQVETQRAVSRRPAGGMLGLSRGHPSHGHSCTAPARLDRALYA